MPRLTFTDVSPADGAGELLEHRIESPRPGESRSGYRFEVSGSALGREVAAVAIELFHDTVLWRVALAGEGTGQRSGFHANATSLALPADFELLVRVVLEDKRRLPLASIRGAREPLRTSYEPSLEPLIVTTIGRSGSTVLVDLLNRHPEVVAYRPREYEARVSAYWMGVLLELSEPESVARQLEEPPAPREHSWLREPNPHVDEILAERASDGGAEPSTEAGAQLPDGLLDWAENATTDALASFAQSRIDALYKEIAAARGLPKARYFVEKYVPNFVPQLVSEVYDGAREVVLVRDFRDMLSSIFAYNEKRGFQSFGRDRAESDIEYVLRVERRSVEALTRSWIRRAERAHLVRYEDLVTRPQETVEALVDYLGLDASGRHLDAMLEPLTGRPAEMEAHRTSVSGSQSIGRWRQDLEPALQEASEEAFGPALEAFGYPRAASIS
jgi:hypothetical protein